MTRTPPSPDVPQDDSRELAAAMSFEIELACVSRVIADHHPAPPPDELVGAVEVRRAGGDQRRILEVRQRDLYPHGETGGLHTWARRVKIPPLGSGVHEIAACVRVCNLPESMFGNRATIVVEAQVRLFADGEEVARRRLRVARGEEEVTCTFRARMEPR